MRNLEKFALFSYKKFLEVGFGGLTGWSQGIFKPDLMSPVAPSPELGAVLNNPWHPPNLISRNRLEIILRHSFLYKFPHIPLGI